jgi:hypothetical protein
MFYIEKSINGKTIQKVENCDESYIWIYFTDGSRLEIQAVGGDGDPGCLFYLLEENRKVSKNE